jgi:DNA primase
MIPQSFVHELLNRLDIVDVVERYVPLKKAGSNYVACCPFHSEKTPSFTVSQAKQFYHCFGCGAHGSAIGFVMEHQGLGFVEAVNELARGAGMTVPVQAESARRQAAAAPEEDLSAILQQAEKYYRGELKRSETAIAYLKKRGVSGEIAARFGIGYAPAAWQNLKAAFPDYAAKALTRAGLVIETDDGKRYDRFRDRIMFPILNQRGAVIGFGGRVLGAGEPKYLNSPETPLFQKGQELYGLFQARKAIRDAGRVIVVEGYMDVVALAQHGIEYAVATLGTATTPVHVQKLMRQADNVVYCFDGDQAGRRAAWRALENSLALVADGKNLSFLFLPQGEDPDSYVRRAGKEGFEKLMREALPLSQFLLQELTGRVDMQTQEGRARLLQLARPLLAQVAAPALGLMLRKRLAELAGIAQTELEELFQIKREARKDPLPREAGRKPPSLARKLLQLLLVRPQVAEGVKPEELGSGEGELKTLAAALEFVGNSPQIAGIAAIIEHFRGTAHEAVLQQVAGEVLQLDGALEDAEVEREFAGALVQLKKQAWDKKIAELLSRSRTQALTAVEKQELQQLLQKGRDLPGNKI